MRFESILLDIDGTLWDSRALVAEGYNLQLRKENHPLRVNAEMLRPLFGKVMTEIADLLLPEMEPEARYALMERCMATENRYLQENPCRIGYPGIGETLDVLRKNHRLFIVSNSQRGYPELCMEKLGIGDRISGHLCFGDTGTSKGQTIRLLMEQENIPTAVYVGDTQGDGDAAREAGIPFLWASYGFGTAEGYEEKLDSFRDLAKLEEAGKL